MQVVDIPVVKIDQAMAEEAVRTGSNIALIATVPSTLAPSRRLIERVAAAQGKTISVREFLIENAYAQLKSGHPEVHNELVKAKIRELEGHYDCIVMAQVSMRALLPALSDVHTPILCSFYSGLQRTVDVLNSL